jgi:transcriptional regulator with XRE-family HTH domain
MTQSQLAVQLGVSKGYVSQNMKGVGQKERFHSRHLKISGKYRQFALNQ